MMVYERQSHEMGFPRDPGSPPSLTPSKSSATHSLRSVSSDENSVLEDASHFEEIGLDDASHDNKMDTLQVAKTPRSPYGPYSSSYAAGLRTASLNHVPNLPPRELVRSRSTRDITPNLKPRPSLPNMRNNLRNTNVRSTNTNQLLSETYMKQLPVRARSLKKPTTQMSLNVRPRSPSPNTALSPLDANTNLRNRRSSWQSTRDRKTAQDLEKECDEDDTDDIPDHILLDNVPLSPRPPSERAKSLPASKEPSPERTPKDKSRRVGNGTPAIATAQGSLRSPIWKSETTLPTMKTVNRRGPPSPLTGRSTSWNMTLAALSKDAQELTEKLELHADEVDMRMQRSSTGSMPSPRRTSDPSDAKVRHKSALAELPPLRRTNILIDPLPISKEKEAVLSRTRPSWLPPKDPREEQRHVREYQKMMAQSQANDRRREAAKRAMSECKDTAADSLMHIWENDIIPRWNDAIRERRTRELWWRGIAPRCRGTVWSKAIGNDLGLTEASFTAALRRAREVESRSRSADTSNEDRRCLSWFADIRRDIEVKTWNDLRIFQVGGPLHQNLVDVLMAYSMYRNDIGYVSGCNTVAALLLLNMPSPAAAFVAFANILNRPIPLSFFTSDPGAKASVYNLLSQDLAAQNKDLHHHLVTLPNHEPDVYLNPVFTALFTGHLAVDEAARLWDAYVFEGDSVLVHAGVALLIKHEMSLLGAKSLMEVEAVLDARKQPPVSKPGDEDRWMKAVRQGGGHA